MARAQRGSLRIVSVRDEAAAAEAAALLAAAEDIPQEEAQARLQRLPLTLREDIAHPDAEEIAEFLHELGVKATFIPPQKPQGGKTASQPARKRISPWAALILPAMLFALAVALVAWILLKT